MEIFMKQLRISNNCIFQIPLTVFAGSENRQINDLVIGCGHTLRKLLIISVYVILFCRLCRKLNVCISLSNINYYQREPLDGWELKWVLTEIGLSPSKLEYNIHSGLSYIVGLLPWVLFPYYRSYNIIIFPLFYDLLST